MKLSIIIPVYNEEETVQKVLDMVSKSKINIKKEIVIIDDGSTDNSKKLIKEFIKKKKSGNIAFKFKSKKNGGKGSAIKQGIKISRGEIIIVQDADLEYDPNEYQELITPIINKETKVVYGSRRLNPKNKQYSTFSFYLGGILVTWLTNMLFSSSLTDEPTCYKVFDSRLIKSIKIVGNGFDWEPEVTAKILKKGIKIKEIPISYYPRSKKHGKKINWKDGIIALWTLFKYRFIN